MHFTKEREREWNTISVIVVWIIKPLNAVDAKNVNISTNKNEPLTKVGSDHARKNNNIRPSTSILAANLGFRLSITTLRYSERKMPHKRLE